jgi:hypothetical protein
LEKLAYGLGAPAVFRDFCRGRLASYLVVPQALQSNKLLAECRVEHIVLDRLHQVLVEADIGSPPAIVGLPVAG